MNARLRIACFFAREHGLSGLHALLGSNRYAPAYLFTHKKRPAFEDPMKGEREDFSRYRETASRHRIPLFTVDSDADASVLDGILDSLTFDLIASISWRRVIPARHLHRAPLGGVNVHRGELPEYAGDKPLHRALRDGRKDVCVTAHRLSEKIDEGEILSSRRHSVNFRGDQSLDENVERIKKELTPFFGPLLLEGLDQVAGQARPNPRDAVRFHADSSAPAGP